MINNKIKTSIFFLFIGLRFMVTAQNDYFPPILTDEWESIPLSDMGWCEENVEELYSYLEENNTKAFMVLKDGKIVIEQYFGTFTADSSWYWASAGKTLTAFLVGLAQEQGYLDIDDPAVNYLNVGWTSCSLESESLITIKHQMTMTSGLDDGLGDIFCTDPECLQCIELPGERWAYHNGPYTLLDGVIESATGSNLNLYVLNELTTSTGITGLFVPVDYNNVFFSKTRSLARFGHLLLNEGNWNGAAILNDNDYFQSMITPSQDINPSYGYLTWLNGQSSYMIPSSQLEFTGAINTNAPDDMYAALGKNGQIINVVPSQRLVVVRIGNAPENDLVPFLLNNGIWEQINNLECDPSSVSDHSDHQYKVYPNPVEDELIIENRNNQSHIVSLYNSFGSKVYLDYDVNRINTSDFPSGIYTIMIQSINETLIEKVIVR